MATNKGIAIDTLRTQLSSSAVIFIGDDVTDENAFEKLHGPDIGIKIGSGTTQASHRVPDPETAVRVLALLSESRRRWLFGERAVPIERHTMLANGRTLALLTPDGTGDVAVPSAARLDRHLRRVARRRLRRIFLGTAGSARLHRQGVAAGAALCAAAR